MPSILTRLYRRIAKRVTLTRHAAAADCFLVSFPKSGRTWFRYVLSHYFNSVAGNATPVDLHSMFAVVPNFDLDPVRGIPAFRFGQPGSGVPRIWVSHFAFRPSLFLKRPVLIMVRDPRDVIVSAYFHATRHKHRYEGTLSDFIDDPEQGMPSMCAYLNSWAKGLEGRRHYVLSYEALSEDTIGETRKVLGFLGVKVNEAALAAAVEAGSFQAMQDRERAEGLPAHEYDRTDADSMRMRRGQAGGFTDYLDAAMVARVEGHCARSLSDGAKALVAQTGLILI